MVVWFERCRTEPERVERKQRFKIYGVRPTVVAKVMHGYYWDLVEREENLCPIQKRTPKISAGKLISPGRVKKQEEFLNLHYSAAAAGF